MVEKGKRRNIFGICIQSNKKYFDLPLLEGGLFGWWYFIFGGVIWVLICEIILVMIWVMICKKNYLTHHFSRGLFGWWFVNVIYCWLEAGWWLLIGRWVICSFWPQLGWLRKELHLSLLLSNTQKWLRFIQFASCFGRNSDDSEKSHICLSFALKCWALLKFSSFYLRDSESQNCANEKQFWTEKKAISVTFQVFPLSFERFWETKLCRFCFGRNSHVFKKSHSCLFCSQLLNTSMFGAITCGFRHAQKAIWLAQMQIWPQKFSTKTCVFTTIKDAILLIQKVNDKFASVKQPVWSWFGWEYIYARLTVPRWFGVFSLLCLRFLSQCVGRGSSALIYC